MIHRMNYPGGKGISFHKIINLMPPHDVYIETHLGGGAIIRKKRAAKRNIAIEINPDVVKKWKDSVDVDFELIQDDALTYLNRFPFEGNELVYCDPPYIRETRRSQKKIYKYDYTLEQHAEFLQFIKRLPCQVMISGYHSDLYERALSDWSVYTFQTRIRQKIATEWIWMNYERPVELHDYRYLGDNYRERYRFKEKLKRWTRRLESMPVLEQQALMHALQTINSGSPSCSKTALRN